MENTTPSVVMKSEITGSYWIKGEGFEAATKEQASPLTPQEVSWLHFTFPKLQLVEETATYAN